MKQTVAMRDDVDFNVAFIGIVKKYPVLYNLFSPDYSNRNKTNRAWVEISSQVNYSVVKCRKRWKNIRSALNRHNKEKFPNGSAVSQKKPYYLATHLEFLRPYIKPYSQTSNYDEISCNEDVSAASVCDSFIDVEEDVGNDSPSQPASEPTSVDKIYKTAKRKLSLEDEAEKYVSARTPKLPKPSSNDGIDEFCLSLAPEIRRVNLGQRIDCKIEILKLISEFVKRAPSSDYEI